MQTDRRREGGQNSSGDSNRAGGLCAVVILVGVALLVAGLATWISSLGTGPSEREIRHSKHKEWQKKYTDSINNARALEKKNKVSYNDLDENKALILFPEHIAQAQEKRTLLNPQSPAL